MRKLFLVCTVCSTPRPVHPESEWYLLHSPRVYCIDCHQESVITEEIRENIRKEKERNETN